MRSKFSGCHAIFHGEMEWLLLYPYISICYLATLDGDEIYTGENLKSLAPVLHSKPLRLLGHIGPNFLQLSKITWTSSLKQKNNLENCSLSSVWARKKTLYLASSRVHTYRVFQVSCMIAKCHISAPRAARDQPLPLTGSWNFLIAQSRSLWPQDSVNNISV